MVHINIFTCDAMLSSFLTFVDFLHILFTSIITSSAVFYVAQLSILYLLTHRLPAPIVYTQWSIYTQNSPQHRSMTPNGLQNSWQIVPNSPSLLAFTNIPRSPFPTKTISNDNTINTNDLFDHNLVSYNKYHKEALPLFEEMVSSCRNDCQFNEMMELMRTQHMKHVISKGINAYVGQKTGTLLFGEDNTNCKNEKRHKFLHERHGHA